jgi:hypothetical protein
LRWIERENPEAAGAVKKSHSPGAILLSVQKPFDFAGGNGAVYRGRLFYEKPLHKVFAVFHQLGQYDFGFCGPGHE